MVLNELLENILYFSKLQEIKNNDAKKDCDNKFNAYNNHNNKVYGVFDKDTKIYTIDLNINE